MEAQIDDPLSLVVVGDGMCLQQQLLTESGGFPPMLIDQKKQSSTFIHNHEQVCS